MCLSDWKIEGKKLQSQMCRDESIQWKNVETTGPNHVPEILKNEYIFQQKNTNLLSTLSEFYRKCGLITDKGAIDFR